jgi:hypothetical protein
MKQRGFVLPAMVVGLCAGVTLTLGGWFAAGRPSPDRAIAPVAPDNDAVQRYRSAQPQHWRACLLQQ